MKGSDRFLKLLEFLKESETQGRHFTLQDLADATGYALSSARTHYSKKLRGYLVFEQDGQFFAKGALLVRPDQFLRHMSQNSERIRRTPTEALIEALRDRARDSFLLALETYNRPTVRNRIEAFCILLSNAWELLLKAEMVEADGEASIFYNSDPERTLCLRDVVSRRIASSKDPVRKNIEKLADLRDQAVHLLIQEMQGRLFGLFQAAVLNFIERYEGTTQTNPLGDAGRGLISLYVDEPATEVTQIRSKYGPRAEETIVAFLQRVEQDDKACKTSKYSVDVNYKLALVKNPKKSDLVLGTGNDGQQGTLIEVPRDPDRTHPYLSKETVALVTAKLIEAGVEEAFSSYDLQAVLRKEKVRSDRMNDYYYLISKPKTHRYSDQLVELIVEKVQQDRGYLQRCRASYRAALDKKKGAAGAAGSLSRQR